MKLAIWGGGGLGRLAIEIAGRLACHELVGLLDDSPAAAPVSGLPVLGGQGDLQALKDRGDIEGVCIAVGANPAREALAARVAAAGLPLVGLADPSAVISPTAAVGAGCLIAPGAVVGPGATLEDLAIVNTACVIEHDARIGRVSYVGPRCLVDARAVVAPGARVPGGTVLAQDQRFPHPPPPPAAPE